MLISALFYVFKHMLRNLHFRLMIELMDLWLTPFLLKSKSLSLARCLGTHIWWTLCCFKSMIWPQLQSNSKLFQVCWQLLVLLVRHFMLKRWLEIWILIIQAIYRKSHKFIQRRWLFRHLTFKLILSSLTN